MAGWNSRYDYDGMSNTEKYLGRKLHVQDNCWVIAKILFGVLIVVAIWGTIENGKSLQDVIESLEYFERLLR